MDILRLSGAFQALLVSLNRRLLKANGVLRLCNVPAAVMEQFQANQLARHFNIYPDLDEMLKTDTSALPPQNE